MPSGTVHATATLMLATGLGVAAYYNQLPPTEVVIGSLSGLLLTPDLDVANGSISNKFARRAGCLVGLFWSAYWWPYRKLFPHRSFWSHGPIISTIIRLIYFAPVLIGLAAVALMLAAVLRFDLAAWWQAHIDGRLCVAALALTDALHWLMDHLFKN